VVGREHRAEGGDHAVEARVGERKLLGVALDPLDLDARVGGVPAGVLEQLRRHVEPDDLHAAERGRDRDVASAARADVEEVEARLQLGALEHALADGGDDPREAVPVACRPGGASPSAQLFGSSHTATLTPAGSPRNGKLA
jgi:hypothetical protein